ncbi:MAG: Rne/Rng family ribonuclease [Planctomycetota bacterium]|nr:Rne/Rng family ribonuclease [Planctomycetota bacterium]
MSEHQSPDANGSGTQGASAQGSSDSSPAFGAGLKGSSKASSGRASKARTTKAPRKKRGTRGGRRNTAGRGDDDAPNDSSSGEFQEEPRAKAPRTRARKSEEQDGGGTETARKKAPARKSRAKKAPVRKRAASRSAEHPDDRDQDDRRDEGEERERPARKATRKRSSARSAARDDDRDQDNRREEGDERERPARRAPRKRTSNRSTARDDDRDQDDRRDEGEERDRPARKRAPRKRSSARREERPREDYDRDDDYDRDRDRDSRGRGRDDDRDRDRGRDDDYDRDGRDDEERAPRRKKATRTRSRRRASSRDDEDDRDRRDDEDEERAPARRSRAKKATSKKKAAKKATKSRRSRSSRDDDGDEDDRDDREESSAKPRKKATRKRSRKSATGKTDEELEAEAEALRTKTILVNSTDPEERRVVVVGKEGRIEDLLMTAESQKNLVNDIYRGKVVNLEPAIGAAFVDFGQGRNGFLHTSDVLPVYGEDGFTLEKLLTTRMEDEDGHPDVDDDDHDDEEEDTKQSSKGSKASKKGGKKGRGNGWRTRQRLPISDLLKVGDQVVVQITKDAIGDKGPTLTTYISIPGRYLVLMPSMARTGVSRKIPDDNERRRLKRILTQLNAPEEMGVIVRTAGVGKLKKDLKRDLDYLLGVWQTFENKLRQGRGPTPLYQESDVATRTLRDLFNKETKEVVVDDFAVHENMVEFAERLMPEHVGRIKRYEGQRPIFHDFSIEQDFEQIFNRSVDLPSGGSIVFDQAEALVAIDVNSGRTRTNSFDFEEVALKTNLEAVPEIALQIRLRDLGGIIVCDFIDMMKSSSNRAVERALRAELAKDRARSKIGRIGQFGLLELTRQRLGPGTHKKVFQACPRCRGTGRIRTVQSRAQAILRRLGSALTQKGFSRVEVRAHPEVVTYLKDHLDDYIRALEHRFEREIQFTSVPDQAEDSVLRYLRVDGREVRPGGRRKR